MRSQEQFFPIIQRWVAINPFPTQSRKAEWELGEEWGRKMGVWKTVIHAAKQDLARWQFWGIVVVGNVRQVISTRTHKAISTEVHKCWFGIQASHYLCCHPSLHFYKSLLARTEGLKENRAAHCTWLLGGKNKRNLICRSGLLVQVKVDLFWLMGITWGNLWRKGDHIEWRTFYL